MSEPVIAETESVDVTPAEPEPQPEPTPAPAPPAEEMIIVSYFQTVIIFY